MALAAAVAAPSSSPVSGRTYARRRPEEGALYKVVQGNLQTLYAAAEDGFAGAPLPRFVRKELEDYLTCGLLCRGLAKLRCDPCAVSRVVAWSCKGRSFCPSCLGRRMEATTANLLDHVVPAVALRQWVLTVPHPLRARLAYDGPLLGAVNRIFVDSVLGWYRRRLRIDAGPGGRPPSGTSRGRGGAVTVVQRCSADVKLNPHLHSVVLDGVFTAAPEPDAKPLFHPLPHLTDQDVADVLQIARARILRYLVRHRVVEDSPDAAVLPDDLADRDPALAALAAAAVSGLPPAGPELRRKPHVIALPPSTGARVTKPLCAEDAGWSLHAATRAGADDIRARQQLLRYVLRPPLAQDHVSFTPDGRVRLQLKRAFRDSTTAVEMDPLSLLSRLAASVFPPRFHSVRLRRRARAQQRLAPPDRPAAAARARRCRAAGFPSSTEEAAAAHAPLHVSPVARSLADDVRHRSAVPGLQRPDEARRARPGQAEPRPLPARHRRAHRTAPARPGPRSALLGQPGRSRRPPSTARATTTSPRNLHSPPAAAQPQPTSSPARRTSVRPFQISPRVGW